jgi:hypothetical protein
LINDGPRRKGAAFAQAVEGPQHGGFRFRVERGGRFVEDEDRRIFQEGAGERETLALTAREGDAAFADGRYRNLAASRG